jgi:hypothetical protein
MAEDRRPAELEREPEPALAVRAAHPPEGRAAQAVQAAV